MSPRRIITKNEKLVFSTHFFLITQKILCLMTCFIHILVENFVLYNLRYNLYLRNLLIKKYFEKIRFLHFS